MPETLNRFNPDYAAAPGAVLAEYLSVRDLSAGEFARLCDRPPELIQGILAGETPVDPDTAGQFARILGLAAHVWLGIEQDYRAHLARRKTPPEREVAAD